ncbi:polyprenyl synthetase family protein [Lentilactobacillus sp. SPB1-3]|uniref:Polyprenyl synthetase family protein n=1 Tax=Lentilactobacillus terminaliae TaxID=3003483 RepID=A0ACD5DCX6_9LACO|nr:farnesyl diphosphate synthase [Lentilactobacillus sp. SPB1-3]MCZ0977158.1 polyprenyl synthetase family protein [Lentilactobacillus sp. SPB1-3]
MINIKQFEDEWIPKINHLLEEQVAVDGTQVQLVSAMQYSVDAGGKRLRPLLALATLISLGQSVEKDTLKAISAVELLHTYSLIHDDLPAMDDDDLRRGKPSNHVVYGDALATLAGDALQALAFQWVSDNQLLPEIKSELALKLAIASGPAGMVAGQADDVLNENRQLNADQLRILHQNKTGALIHYSVESGLIVGGLKPSERQQYLRFADDYGLAFQIYDDILDVTSSQETLGKPVHQDAGKNTYPNLFGMEESKRRLKATINDALDALNQIQNDQGYDTEILKALCGYFKIEEI